MKKGVIFSMLLLFMGAGVKAQSVADAQMDERFNDGTWARFQSGGGAERHYLTAFRGYFEADAPAAARQRAAALPGTYKTLFQMMEQEGTDNDGTHRYFDMQGRMLNVKPGKELYIKNGKKFINR